MLVVATAARELNILALNHVHDEEIEISGQSFTPGKRDQRAIWAPGGTNRFTTFGNESPHVRALVVHNVDLRGSTAVRDKRKVTPSLGIPSWRDVNATAIGQPLEVASANIRHIDFRILRLTGGKGDSLSVWSPRRCC